MNLIIKNQHIDKKGLLIIPSKFEVINIKSTIDRSNFGRGELNIETTGDMLDTVFYIQSLNLEVYYGGYIFMNCYVSNYKSNYLRDNIGQMTIKFIFEFCKKGEFKGLVRTKNGLCIE